MKLQIRHRLGGHFVLSALLLGAVVAPAGAAFVENLGQTHSDVLFYVPSAEAAAYLTTAAVILDLHSPRPAHAACALRVRLTEPGHEAVPASSVVPAEPLETRYGFIHGNDPSRWRTDVPSFGTVTYHDLRPGVDLAFRYEDGLLFYEWTGTGAAGPFVYEGADAVTPRPDGSRSIATAVGEVVEVPLSSDGLRGVLLPPGRSLPDAAKEWRDDPTALLWSTFLGGASSDLVHAMAQTPAGNVVLVGGTFSGDFPIVAGAYDDEMRGGSEGFVALLSSDGSTLAHCTWMGGAADDVVTSVVLSDGYDPVITGWTTSGDFPTTAGAFDTSLNGGAYDTFACKLYRNLHTLLWGTYLGGSGHEYGRGIQIDSDGNCIVVGNTTSSNFPVGGGGYDTTYNGGEDGFVVALNSSGASMNWGTYIGGSDDDVINAVEVDPNTNEVSVVGVTSSTDFPTTMSAYDHTYNGGDTDGFLARLEVDGGLLLTGTYLGGSGDDEIHAICLPNRWDHIITGTTESSNFPTTAGAFDRQLGGGRDAFVAKMNCFNSTMTWSTFLGGTGEEHGLGVAGDPAGNWVVTGETNSHNFPTTMGAYDQTNIGSACYVTRLGSAGESVISSTYLAGPYVVEYDEIFPCGVAVSGTENVIVAGFTGDATFPTTASAYDPTWNGYDDGFVSKLRLSPDASAVEVPSDLIPSHPELVFANPIACDGTILLRLPADDQFALQVTNAAGREVSTLGNGAVAAGETSFRWTGRDSQGAPLASGTYFLRLSAGGTTQSWKVVWVR